MSKRKEILILTLIICFCILIIPQITNASYPFVSSWGIEGINNSEFNFPYHIANDSKGNIYIVDSSNHRIQKFTSEGVFMTKWGAYGNDDGEFYGPIDIAIDSLDNVYVVENQNKRIQKFTSEGVFITKWGQYNKYILDYVFADPRGIAIDSQDNVYVVDRYYNKIKKYTSDGVFIKEINKPSGEWYFNFTEAITIDNSDNIYVVNMYTGSLQKMTSDGLLLWQKVHVEGIGDGEFDYASDIAFDSSGNIYIADSYNYRIQVLTPEGEFVTKWGSRGSEEGEFERPQGILIDNIDNIYIVDTDNDRIQKFAIENDTNTDPPEPPSTDYASCSDSDNGQEYYTQGQTQRENEPAYTDTCLCPINNNHNNLAPCEQGLYLREYYCGYKNFIENINKYECAHGCSNGACLAEDEDEDDQGEDNDDQGDDEQGSTNQDEEGDQGQDEDNSAEEPDVDEDTTASSTEEAKIVICHIPPGNPDNAKTIEVAISAAQALLDQGSYMGQCNQGGEKDDPEVSNIKLKAKMLVNNTIETILQEITTVKDKAKEKITKEVYLDKIQEGIANALPEKIETALNNFLTYGADFDTKKLGAGERAAVVHSFKRAFNKLPETEDELIDIIKIANGRWPSTRNEEAEKEAQEQFQKIYKKEADMNNPRDNAAITIMAYGLRQKAQNRNLESEKQALKTFAHIYGYIPETSEDWDILQAITYSGARR